VNILVVEDNLVECRQLESYLVRRGFTVQVAVDVQSAWESMQAEAPDAILLDLNIPGGTGLRLLNQLAGSSRLRTVPVIVITGMEDPVVQRMAEQHSVEVIFSKPVDFRKLDASLESLRMKATMRGASEG